MLSHPDSMQTRRRPHELWPASMLLAILFASSAQAADDLHIWVRGFIPDSAETTGVASHLVTSTDGQCFGTDQRSWSEDATAASRVSSDFHLVLDGTAQPVVRPTQSAVNSAAMLRQVDCQTGQDLAVTQTQLLADVVGTPSQTDTHTQVNVFAAVPDPQRAWSSATINYDATFTYDSVSRTLDYHATTGQFPAYEAYASLNNGPAVTVFRSGPFHRNESTESAKVELQGSVSLVGVKRPKAPTNLTIQ